MGLYGLLAHNQCTEIADVPGTGPQIGEQAQGQRTGQTIQLPPVL